MKPLVFSEMWNHILQEFQIAGSTSEMTKCFKSSMPFSRFVRYAKELTRDSDLKDWTENSDFQIIFASHEFDKKLRMVLFDAIVRIEEGVTAALFEAGAQWHMAEYIGDYEGAATWYADPNAYDATRRIKKGRRWWPDEDMYATTLKSLSQEYNPRGVAYQDWTIHRHLAPEYWKLTASRALSFSDVDNLLRSLRDEVLNRTSVLYGAKFPDWALVQGAEISKWISHIRTLRNQCAHGNSIWCDGGRYDVPLPTYFQKREIHDWEGHKLYILIALMALLLKPACPEWLSEMSVDHLRWQLSSLLDESIKHWASGEIDLLMKMGFPQEWQKMGEWN